METEKTEITLSSDIEEIVKQHTNQDTSLVCCKALEKMFNVV